MATVYTPPIDLYAESREGFGEEETEDVRRLDPAATRPTDNGDRDEPAIEDCYAGLARVLGW